jgi:hypothetical protein
VELLPVEPEEPSGSTYDPDEKRRIFDGVGTALVVVGCLAATASLALLIAYGISGWRLVRWSGSSSSKNEPLGISSGALAGVALVSLIAGGVLLGQRIPGSRAGLAMPRLSSGRGWWISAICS